MKKLLLFVVILICASGLLLVLRVPAETSETVFVTQNQSAPVETHDAALETTQESETPEESRVTSVPAPEIESFTEPIEQILLDVPFTSQAPFGQWSDPLFQDGCEEASLLMAARYFRGKTDDAINSSDATAAITTLSHYARDTYGFYLDIAAADVAHLANDFYDHITATYATDLTREDIIAALADDALVVLPMNGTALSNPNFTNGGPQRHALLVIGYDPVARAFITNDPGTRNGHHYRYDEDVLIGAIRDYVSGYHEPFPLETKTAPETFRRGVIVRAL